MRMTDVCCRHKPCLEGPPEGMKHVSVGRDGEELPACCLLLPSVSRGVKSSNLRR